MKKEKIQKDILVLSILTFLTALSWITFDVYRALTKTKIPKVLQQQTIPLDPSIDRELLIKLKSRVNISRDELNILKEKTEEAKEENQSKQETSTKSAAPKE